MKLAVMQPYIFPYLGYFQLYHAADKFVIYDDVNYITRGWINRNNILVNGRANRFTVPVRKASQNKLIYEIELIENPKWRKKLLKTIDLAYCKAPHFEEVFPVVEAVFSAQAPTIRDLAVTGIRKVAAYLDLNTALQPTSRIYDNAELKGQHRILDICLREQADTYLNPIGGMDLYDPALFETNGVELFFIKSKPVVYQQFDNAFVPNLSLIDVLMFNDKTSVRQLLKEYEPIRKA